MINSFAFRGIPGVYQHYPYRAEKRAALQRWADHIEGLVTDKTGDKKVVRMPAARIGG